MVKQIVSIEIFSARFAEVLDASNETVYSVAEQVSLSPGTISRYANGKMAPKIPTLYALAAIFRVSPMWLMGYDVDKFEANTTLKNSPEPESVAIVTFPVVGSIAAGYGTLAVEEYTGDYEYIPASDICGDPNNYFVLRVDGDSMYPKLLNGDRVLVRRTRTVDSGKIAVVLYDGEKATVKKVNYIYGENWLELIPINPEYQTKRIECIDLEQCLVLGEVIKLMRNM